MRLVFCLFKYFPFGGLQRDFLRIAQESVARGHTVDVYTMQWEGEIPAGITVNNIAVSGLSNHRCALQFIKKLQQSLRRKNYNVIVGFNKMPGLDVYYAADSCYAAKAQAQHRWFYRCMPRYRYFFYNEKAVFHQDAKTKILLLSNAEKKHFITYYQTPEQRFYLLPPGISRDRIAPENAQEIRQSFRQEFSIADTQQLLLMVGSGFRTKGVDRAIQALASLPLALKKNTLLMIIGADNEKPYLKLAQRLSVVDQIKFLGGRHDVPRFLLGADLLIHPAYRENTGTVLLEAIVAGLPVLASEVCGYAHHIVQADAGLMIPEPFRQEQFNHMLLETLMTMDKKHWQKNALTYAQRADIYRLPQSAVDVIEVIGAQHERV